MIEIKFIYSPDTSGKSIESWTSDSAEDVFILIQMDIGQVNTDAISVFSCVIATPEALMKRKARGEKILSDRALIVVNDFDWPEIQRHLNEIVIRCRDTDQIAEQWKLQRYFIWEYEDYIQND